MPSEWPNLFVKSPATQEAPLPGISVGASTAVYHDTAILPPPVLTRAQDQSAKWPEMFFGRVSSNYLPPAVEVTAPPKPAKNIPAIARVPTAAPARPSMAKWPDVFFPKAIAAAPVESGISAPAIQVSPAANPVGAREESRPKTTVSARIVVPPRPAEDNLPKVSLPAPKKAPAEVPIQPAAQVYSPTLPPSGPGELTSSPGSLQVRSVVLTNGETISGSIVSETSDTIYLHHESLGVLTVPKSAVASRYIEVALKNGDFLLGELIADAPQFLLVRSHALGTLTIPRASIHQLG